MSSQNEKVVVIPAAQNVQAEREQVVQALLSSLKDLRDWKELIGGEGLVSSLVSLLLAMLEMISKPASQTGTSNPLSEAVDALGSTLLELQERLANPAFGELSSPADFTRLAGQLTAKAALSASLAQAVAEKEKLARQLSQQQVGYEAELSELNEGLKRELAFANCARNIEGHEGQAELLVRRFESAIACFNQAVISGLRRISTHGEPLGSNVGKHLEEARQLGLVLGNLIEPSDQQQTQHQLPMVTQPPLVSPPATNNLAGLRELKGHLAEWLASLRQTLTEVGGRIEELEDNLSRLEELSRLGDGEATARAAAHRGELNQLNNYSRVLVQAEQPQKQRLAELDRYLKAVELVAGGVPESLLQVDLPELASLGELHIEVETVPVEEFVAMGEEPVMPIVITDRREQINRLADVHGMRPNQVFIATLYDLVPRRDGRVRNKGAITVLLAAERAGLLRSSGWPNVQEALSRWRDRNNNADPVHLYIKPGGTFQKVAMYHRTSAELPWRPQEIFLEEEILAFQAEVMKRFDGV